MTVQRRGLMMRGWRRSIPRTIASPATVGLQALVQRLGKVESISSASGSWSIARWTISVSMKPK